MSSPTVEMVQFRLKPGVDQDAFLTAVADAQAALGRMPGFVSREVLKNDDGLWVDLVHWQSYDQALAAAEAFGSHPELAAFGALIDETQMTMLHFDQARRFD